MGANPAVAWSLTAVLLVQACILIGVAPGAGRNPSPQLGGATLPTLARNPMATAPSNVETKMASSPDASPVPSVSDVSPVIGAGWDGLSIGSSGLTPPDVQIAVGPNHVVEAVNVALGIYSKQGVSIAATEFSTLLGTGSDYVGDPRIEYDRLSGRWFVTLADFSTGQVLVAASTSPDPTGRWSTYRVPSSPTSVCLDQPILGVGTLNVIVSVNIFSSCFSPNYTYDGARFWVINKTDLVSGALNPALWPSPQSATDVSVHPARMEGRSDVQYLVATQWDLINNSSSVLQLFTVSGSPPGEVRVSETKWPMGKAEMPPSSAQAGSPYLLDTGDFRIADAVWSHGVLWLGFNQVCKAISWTACIRVIELDTTSAAIRQDFQLSSPSRAYFYPALALDAAGNLAVLFGYASGSDFPGLMATGRLIDDPVGVLQPAVLVRAGAGVDESSCRQATGRCRYGDYFGASSDPSDPTQVWLAGEFGRGSLLGWGTYVSLIRMKAMLTLDYSVDSGPPPPIGPTLRFVRNGSPDSATIGTEPTTFLADPGTAWQIDSNFTTPSGLARYVSRASDAANLGAVANRSVSVSLVYQVQYLLAIAVGPGGSVVYAAESAHGTVLSGMNGTVYLFAGTVVNVTAVPSSILWVFAGWTGDLAGNAPAGFVALAEPRSVTARFAPNWSLIGAVATVIVIAAVALIVFLYRRTGRSEPPPSSRIPPPPSPPEGSHP